MPRILVNYRRDDSAAYAGRVADRLREHFGSDNVFIDIDAIRPGEDFVERIDRSIAACDVMVAVIGKSWLGATDANGRRRLDREDDFVRTEIAKALERHVRIIPTLVGGAVMPEAGQLPQNLVALSRRHAFEISDTRFHQDVDCLISALAEVPGSPAIPEQKPVRPKSPAPRPAPPKGLTRAALGVGVVALAGVAFWVWTARNPSSSGADASPPGAADTVRPDSGGSSSSPPPSTATAGNGSPGTALPAPALPPVPVGKTGIQVIWRGSRSIDCYLYDETGTKTLSPGHYGEAWRCNPGMDVWDAAPGKYQIKFGSVATTMPPLPVTVTRGHVVRVEPKVGQLRLQWNGSNNVPWYLLDETSAKTLSPGHYGEAWRCDPGKSCTRDLGPGTYMVKVGAAGYQPVKVTIAAFRTTAIAIP